ncbi:MAG: hypothetical protein ACR2RF_24950 [Geminicoccaceae bacterium]
MNDLFDAAVYDSSLARKLRDIGIQRADEHAVPEWKEAALVAVYDCARNHEEFLVDQVRSYLGAEHTTHEQRAMGGVMRRAASLGWIFPTDRFRGTNRATSHKGPRRVWRSLLS